MDAGLDTGPVLTQRAEPILPDDTTETLTERLAHLGASLLVETLPGYLAGTLAARPQDDSQATYARQLKKEDGQLDWTQPAAALARQVRAFSPWPGASTVWQGQRLRIVRAHPEPGFAGAPGRVLERDGEVLVGTGEGSLALEEVQPAGRRAMPALAFARGARDFVGTVLPVVSGRPSAAGG
jgi:methionyl-tRNA formyltransferase